MTREEIAMILANLKNIELKLGEVAGAILCVEVQMRLICQLCKAVADELKGDDYLKTKLVNVEKAIVNVFKNQLQSDELKKIERLLIVRNKLLHGDFVQGMKRIDVFPSSREIISSKCKKEIDKLDIREAIISLDKNHALDKVLGEAKQVQNIMERLIMGLAKS